MSLNTMRPTAWRSLQLAPVASGSKLLPSRLPIFRAAWIPNHRHRASKPITSRVQLHTSTPCRSGLQNIFEQPERPALSIVKLTDRGFHLSDQLVVPGGLIILDHRAFLWDVDPPSPPTPGGWGAWTKDRFAMFESVSPRPEILLFGTGRTVVPPPKEVREYVSSLGIQMDVMDSRNAASTYNLLIEEGRRIGVALCPLHPVDPRTGSGR